MRDSKTIKKSSTFFRLELFCRANLANVLRSHLEVGGPGETSPLVMASNNRISLEGQFRGITRAFSITYPHFKHGLMWFGVVLFGPTRSYKKVRPAFRLTHPATNGAKLSNEFPGNEISLAQLNPIATASKEWIWQQEKSQGEIT